MPLRWFAIAFIEVGRGTPALVILFLACGSGRALVDLMQVKKPGIDLAAFTLNRG